MKFNSVDMKNFLLTLSLLFFTMFLVNAQESDQQVVKCLSGSGSDAKYLKDFRVQLGKADAAAEYRFKANISLWQGMTYRFTMCNMDGSNGALVLNMQDEAKEPCSVII